MIPVLCLAPTLTPTDSPHSTGPGRGGPVTAILYLRVSSLGLDEKLAMLQLYQQL